MRRSIVSNASDTHVCTRDLTFSPSSTLSTSTTISSLDASLSASFCSICFFISSSTSFSMSGVTSPTILRSITPTPPILTALLRPTVGPNMTPPRTDMRAFFTTCSCPSLTSSLLLSTTALTLSSISASVEMITSLPAIHSVLPCRRTTGVSFFGLQASSQSGLLSPRLMLAM